MTGYWLVASDGGVFSFNAPFQGSTGSIRLNKPVVGHGPRSHDGWLLAGCVRRRRVLLQRTVLRIDRRPSRLNKPVVAIAPVSDGSGYRLVASDGGVFSYNAPFYGSAGSIKLNKPVVGGVNNNSYDGYWLFASDGGVFTYSPTNEGMPFFGLSRIVIYTNSRSLTGPNLKCRWGWAFGSAPSTRCGPDEQRGRYLEQTAPRHSGRSS